MSLRPARVRPALLVDSREKESDLHQNQPPTVIVSQTDGGFGKTMHAPPMAPQSVTTPVPAPD
jgi:hypothetical protein